MLFYGIVFDCEGFRKKKMEFWFRSEFQMMKVYLFDELCI